MKNAHVAGLISAYLSDLGFTRASCDDGRLLYVFRCPCGCGKIHRWSSELPDRITIVHPERPPEIEQLDVSDLDHEAFALAVARDQVADQGWDFEKGWACARLMYNLDGTWVQ